MAKIIAHNPQRAKLKASGYMGEPTGDLPITENGQFNVKPYATATVAVPQPHGQAPTITENGTYDVTEYETVEADVQSDLIDKTITVNGTYTAAQDGADGYREVEVSLPFEQKEVTPSTIQQTVTPTPNTQYQALSEVIVKPTPLESATITPTTQQQTITPAAPNIGFDSVTVEAVTSSIDPNIKEQNIKKDVSILGKTGTYEGNPNANLDLYIQGSLLDIVTNVSQIGNNTFSYSLITNIQMPNVVRIGDNAFQNCVYLELNELPAGLTYLGSQAFRGASLINVSVIPNGVTQIISNCFRDCKGLTTIIMPPNLTAIGGNAFNGCTGLLTFDMSNVVGVASIQSTSFTSTTCIFLFRDQTQLDAYASATNWSALADRFQIKGA